MAISISSQIWLNWISILSML